MSITLKHPLAFNLEGDPISLPSAAFAWRVRKVPRGCLSTRRGDPPIIIKHKGSPLHVPLSATADDVRVCAGSGLFRLDAVRRDLRVLSSVEPVYVELAVGNATATEFGAALGIAVSMWLVGAVPALPPPLPRKQEPSNGVGVVR